jgi:Zinc finger, C2H2 type/Zinc-finger of C2H2 type
LQERKPEFVNVDSPLIKKKKEAQKNTEIDLNTARAVVESMEVSQKAGSADEIENIDDERLENDANNNDEEEEYNGPIQFACCMCVNLFETEDELLAHAKTHDIPVRDYLPGKTVECRLCLKRFTKAKNYNNHIKGLYEEKKVCQLCGLRVPGNLYQEHMADHADPDAQAELDLLEKQRRERKEKNDRRRGPKKKCPECDREFTLNTHLNIHIKAVHLKEKPYKCEICGSAFAYKDSLSKHSLKHSNERKFTCHLCPKTYIYRADLRVHLQRHENIRNFSCNLCELKFFSNKHLKQHMVTHNPDSIWKCNMCDKSYRQQYTLTKHKFAEHKIPIQKRGSNLFGRGYQDVEPVPRQYDEVIVEEAEEHLMEELEETVEGDEDDPDYIVQETHFDGEYETVPVVEIPI